MSEASRRNGLLGRALVLSIALVIALGGGIAACGGDDDEEPTDAETTEEPAEEPTDGDDGTDGADGGAAGDATAGQQVFADTCATCHGDQGEGTDQAPSLQDSSAAANPDAVSDQVTNGGGGMPAFEGQLSEQEIADVTAYVTEEIAGP